MPTIDGKNWARWSHGVGISNGHGIVEVYPDNRDLAASSNVSTISDNGNGFWVSTGIQMIIWTDDDGTHYEYFDPPVPTATRTGVTTVWFRTEAHGCYVRANHQLDFFKEWDE